MITITLEDDNNVAVPGSADITMTINGVSSTGYSQNVYTFDPATAKISGATFALHIADATNTRVTFDGPISVTGVTFNYVA